jgi:hypothetical protein
MPAFGAGDGSSNLPGATSSPTNSKAQPGLWILAFRRVFTSLLRRGPLLLGLLFEDLEVAHVLSEVRELALLLDEGEVVTPARGRGRLGFGG